jgi:hypothetical protein
MNTEPLDTEIDVTVRHAANRPGKVAMHRIFPGDIGLLEAKDRISDYVRLELLNENGKIWVASSPRTISWRATLEPEAVLREP